MRGDQGHSKDFRSGAGSGHGQRQSEWPDGSLTTWGRSIDNYLPIVCMQQNMSVRL